MAVLLPQGRQQFFDAAGAPLAGGKVHTYAAGTSTPQATYTDAAGAVANANPVVLNARGEAIIFWAADAAYKVVVTDADGATIWTQDDVSNPGGGPSGSSNIGFIQSGAGAVARSVQSKLRETVSVQDFGAVGDGVTDDSAAVLLAFDLFATGSDNNASFKAQKTIVFTAGKKYRIASAITLSQRNGISIDATGATIIFDVDGPGITFDRCNYPHVTGGFWIVNRDTANAEAFYFERSKFGKFLNLNIAAASGSYSSNNNGFTLQAPASGINDTTSYITFENVRVNRLNTPCRILDDHSVPSTSSRTIYNHFRNCEFQCRNGPLYRGTSENHFDGLIEVPDGNTILQLLDNALGLGSSANFFEVRYVSGGFKREFGANSKYNVVKDHRSANPTNQSRSHGSGYLIAGDAVVGDQNEGDSGGIRRVQPRDDIPQSMGGRGGINLLKYSRDFTKWTAVNCTVVADPTLTDPNGNYSPNGTAYKLTQTAPGGCVYLDTAQIGNATRHRQYTGRVWVYSDTGVEARVNLELRTTAPGVRSLSQKRLTLPPGKWVLVNVGQQPADSGSADFYRLTIYPNFSYTGAAQSLWVCEAGVSKGYGHAHFETDGASDPRGPSDGVIGAALAAASHLYLGGVDRDNVLRAVTFGSSAPASGAWVAGDVMFNSAPTAGGMVGWVCVAGGTPGTWKSFGAIVT